MEVKVIARLFAGNNAKLQAEKIPNLELSKANEQPNEWAHGE